MQRIEKQGYTVLGDLPRSRLIPVNIAVGKMWESGMPMFQRHPYYRLYEKVMEIRGVR